MLELDDAENSARHSVVTTPVRTTPAAVLANPSRADTRNASAWVMRVITDQCRFNTKNEAAREQQKMPANPQEKQPPTRWQRCL